jgi:hypothetical protein
VSEPRVLATAAGDLCVAPLSPEAADGLAELFAEVATLESGGRELLGLVMRDGERRMTGLRTGYGWFEPKQATVARRAALFGRMRLPRALALFRERGFDGALMAGACVLETEGGPVQEGELVFAAARSPLPGGIESPPIGTYEKLCGPHTSNALLTFIADVDQSWKAGGIAERTLTDFEPCPPDLPSLRWFADLVLVGRRLVLVRQELEPEDPLLGAIVEAGIEEVEFTPSVFLIGTGEDGEPAR